MELRDIVATLSYVLVAGLLVSGTLYETSKRDLCADGEIWEPTEVPHLYHCSSEAKNLFCSRLSGSERTCYIAEFIEDPGDDLEVQANGKVYFCNGKDLYSKCITEKNIEAYYGELV